MLYSSPFSQVRHVLWKRVWVLRLDDFFHWTPWKYNSILHFGKNGSTKCFNDVIAIPVSCGFYIFGQRMVISRWIFGWFPCLVHWRRAGVGMARTAAIWTPLLVGIHRYIVVCKPLLAATVCTVSNARKHFVGVVVISVIFNLPAYYEFHMKAGTTNLTVFNSISIYQSDTGIDISNVTDFNGSCGSVVIHQKE